MPRKASRREFLKGQAAIDALGDLTHGAEEMPPPSSVDPVVKERLLMHIGREAMACQFEVLLNAGQDSEGPEAAVAALDRIDELEAQLTVYRDRSEVMHVNRTAFSRPVPVETELFRLLQRSAALAKATGGAFDITSGPLTQVWGFYRRQGQMPSEAEVAAALAKVGSEKLELDATNETVRFGCEGMELNLGSIGKGYALDRAAEKIIAAQVQDFCFHGGMSSVLARGQRQRNSQQGWQVALKNPLRPEERLAVFWLRDQALGTSGSGTQYFHHQGKRYGHILDPRTGWPADRSLSATVIAPTAEAGDSLATALYVMGLEEAREFLKDRPELSVVLAVSGPQRGSLQLHVWNLAEDVWQLQGTEKGRIEVVVER